MEPSHKIADTLLSIIVVVLLIILGYGGYRFYTINGLYLSASSSVVSLQGELLQAEEEKTNLRDELNLQESRVNNLEDQIEELSGTVGEFEKLSKLDPELLQKYSKVYFLNENYTPPRLVTIDKDLLYDEKVAQQIHRQVRSFLENLIQDAEDDDVELFIVSAYRSFGTQTALKTGYTVSYGSGANAFSADQGYSEHQLGTTIDFTTTGLNGGLDGFGATSAYTWLDDNAYKYGFVLSYPQGNTFYQFEPWHWRFVGTDLARILHRKKINFYDMDQREIDKYLISIFD
ncbi:MAG: D-alanyl-D-alanine carboxypeptidase family protein [Candidatus Campbellbacteria bacterium]|nr:D-alanyl-D-alanine carboxypeptidase family protein [Candidatus Campbellbacteria bacterium]